MRLEGPQRAGGHDQGDGARHREAEAITLRYKGKARPTPWSTRSQSLREHVKKLRGKIQATARKRPSSNAITNKKQELIRPQMSWPTRRLDTGLETDAQRLQQAINRLLYEKQRRAELQAAKEATVGRYGFGEARPNSEPPEHASEVDAALSRGPRIWGGAATSSPG